MRLRTAVLLVVIVAVFPTLAVGVAQQTVHAAVQTVSSLVGSPRG
ncbi:MAG TPA: hypothetical protein VG034_19960 [Acidimicrobiia bacterium]|nr:hypothetical protein [Acidimicrobiia bacterium]